MNEKLYLKDFIGIENLPEIGDPGAYGRAVLTVLGADGEVSDRERSFLLEHVKNMGFPQVILNELRNFDCQKARFDDFAGAINHSSAGKMLLYDAVRGSMVDQYAEREQEAVACAASTLGISEEVVRAIEGLARLETTLNDTDPDKKLSEIRDALRAARIALIAPAKEELDVDAIAQAKRFHSTRSGLEGKDQIPANFVNSVRAFQAAMNSANEALAGDSPDEGRLRGQVLQACQDFSVALLDAVRKQPKIEAAIGAFGFRETFQHFMLSAISDRSYTKPRGYAGDYLTMEMIYNNDPHGENKLGEFIDQWVLNIRMGQAVRNRRKLLTQAITDCYNDWTSDEPMPVTCLASGSAREVFDMFSAGNKPNIKITCTDIDPEVHAYAAGIAADVGAIENTVFLQDNILKLIRGSGKTVLPPQQMIYAAGLIDYLRDRQLVTLLNWVYDHLRPGGRVVIGQYHSDSPDKPFLDHILDWVLYYRTEDQMKQLFAQSKFGGAPVDITMEDAGVQMFLGCNKT